MQTMYPEVFLEAQNLVKLDNILKVSHIHPQLHCLTKIVECNVVKNGSLPGRELSQQRDRGIPTASLRPTCPRPTGLSGVRRREG